MISCVRNQRGFTLIETMISSGILLGIVLVFTTYQVQMTQLNRKIDLQTQAHLAVSEIIYEVLSSPGHYPNIADGAAAALAFISCYDLKGKVVAGKYKTLSPVGFPVQGRVNESGVCTEGMYEVHVYRRERMREAVWVDILRKKDGHFNELIYSDGFLAAPSL